MNLRPRAAAIILNAANELLVLRQENPLTGFEWWTLPGGGMEPEESIINTIIREVEEECNIHCRPVQLIYISEYVDYTIDTHHLGMFFLTTVDNIQDLKVGTDPEVEVQYIKECRFMSEEELKTSHIPIFPPVFKEQFWKDLKANFRDYEIYQHSQIQEQK